MSVAENVLRLHRRQLDERRRYLSELERLAERLRADADRLKAHIDEDASIRHRPGQDDAKPGPFEERLIERRNKLERSISEIETQMIDARTAVAAAENEVGRHELAAAHRAGAIGHRSRRARGLAAKPLLAR